MDIAPFLKGSGINKKPISIYIDFQVTVSKSRIVNAPKSLKATNFWNSLKLAHEFSREHFWISHFFTCLVMILLFQKVLPGIVGNKI